MASIERFVFNHNFDEYKYQEGWNDQLYSELHININNKITICNSKMYLNVTGTAEAPLALRNIPYKAFRAVKFEDHYVYVTMYEVEPTPGRIWLAICDTDKVGDDINNSWKIWYCKNSDKSDMLQYRWLDITDPYIYISNHPTDGTAYEGIENTFNVNGKLDLLTRKADLNIDVAFIRVNSESVSSSSYNLIDYNKLCKALSVKDIDWDAPDTNVIIEKTGSSNLQSTSTGYSGVKSSCHKPNISLGRYHDPENLSTYGSWPTNRSDIYATSSIIHIQVHNATFTSYID